MDKQYAVLITIGIELVVLEALFASGGIWLDKNVGWNGWGLIVGATLALIGWVIHLLILLRNLAKEEEASEKDSK